MIAKEKPLKPEAEVVKWGGGLGFNERLDTINTERE